MTSASMDPYDVRIRRSWFARAGLTLLALAGCQAEEPVAVPRSVLLVTVDTLRADALGCYGSERGATPILDRLAEESVVFDRAFTVAPITLPAHASLFTGLYPPRHAVRDNGLWPLPKEARTLAEIASEAGYATGAFVGASVLDNVFGLGQGFDTYRNANVQQSSVVYTSRPADQVVDDALRWLDEQNDERPFFLWVHLYDPHAPYEPPAKHAGRREGAELYFGEVAFADEQIGRLLSRLERDGRRESTLVAVTSDHGEAFGEHDEFTHGPYCYDSTLHIPLLLRWPGGAGAGTRDTALVSLVDLFPTLLGAMDLGVPAAIDGRSFPEADGGDSADRGVYFESYLGHLSFGWSPLAGWRDDGGKYLHSSRPQFFAVQDGGIDEGTDDVADQDVETLRRYREAIEAVAARPTLTAVRTAPIDERLLDGLRALGYAPSGAAPPDVPHPLADTGLPSPSEQLLEYAFFLRAVALTQSGDREGAIAVFRRILEGNPNNRYAADQLGALLVDVGKLREAVPFLEQLVEQGRARSITLQNLAACYSALGRADEAIEVLQRALVLDPGNGAALDGLIRTLRREGRGLEAEPLRTYQRGPR